MATTFSVTNGQVEDYDQLKVQIETWIGRKDKRTVESIPLFINMAEKRIYRNLRIPAFEVILEVEVGVDGTIDIPSNLLDFKHVYIETPAGETGRVILTRGSISDLHDQNFSFARTGSKVLFSDNITRRFEDPTGVTPNKSGAIVTFIYYADQPELSDANTNNILLTISPDLLIFGAMAIEAAFNSDPEEEQRWNALYADRYAEIETQNQNLEYSGGAMVISQAGANFEYY